MQSFFNDSNKVKKLALLILICGISLGLIIIGVTAICDHNSKKKAENNIFNKITDDITDYYYGSNNSYRNSSSDKIVNDSSQFFKGTTNAFGNAYRKAKYTPWYFIGGIIILLSVGGSVTLIILDKMNVNKKK